MPDPENFDVKKVVERATSKITVNELQRRGVQHVKVLDEKTLQKLFKDALENILMGRAGTLSEADRQRIYDDSRKELDRLMNEYSSMKKQQDVVLQDKNALAKELDNLQKQVDLTKKTYEERLRQKENEAALLKSQVETLQAQLELAKQKGGGGEERYREGQESQKPILDMLKEQVKNAQDSADRKYSEGVRSQEPMIAELKERIQSLEVQIDVLRKERDERLMVSQDQADLYKKLEELHSKDEATASKLGSLFMRTVDGLTRKINTIKLGTGGSSEVVYKPNEFVLDSLLREELESNIGGIAAQKITLGEGKKGDKMDDRVSKLKSIRASFEGKKEGEGAKEEQK